jgi:hypothetical protein
MSYLDDLATTIRDHAIAAGLVTPDLATCNLNSLFRLYAVLALAKGEAVTAEDVHNAWAAWRQDGDGDDSAVRPFRELDPETQDEDRPYVEAIRSALRNSSTVTGKR